MINGLRRRRGTHCLYNREGDRAGVAERAAAAASINSLICQNNELYRQPIIAQRRLTPQGQKIYVIMTVALCPSSILSMLGHPHNTDIGPTAGSQIWPESFIVHGLITGGGGGGNKKAT